MRDHDYQGSADFLKRLFGETLHKVELRACANERGGATPSIFARDEDAFTAFCRRHDGPGYGVYFGACTRHEDATSGNAASAMECPAAWVDIDCLAQGIKGDDALQALRFLPEPPSIIINSGGGLHAYWIFEEPIDVAEGSTGRDQVLTILRRLAAILAGDSKCAEIARIMRLPGTHNSKPKTMALYNGEMAQCAVVEDNGRVHDIDTLTEWLEGQRAVLHGTAEAAKPVRENDPFVSYARSVGYEPSIDIDQALAAMSHEAAGDNSIHQTQLRVSASMIARGYDDDEIVARILAATEAAAPRDARWNWAREERALRQMVTSGRAKGFAEKREKPTPPVQPIASGNAALAVVHDLNEERAKREPKAKKAAGERRDEISVLGGAVLDAWQDRHGPILHSRGTSYAYEEGVWMAWDEQHDQMLRVMMQEACASLKLAPKSSLISDSTRYMMNHPTLLERGVEFDQHGLIIAGDGTIDPKTGQVGEHSPTHRAAFKVGALLTGSRACPAFISFLEDCFADKEDDERAAIIRTVQEWFGACLIPHKPRALLKGLLVHGPSHTGKTQLSEILRALLGRGQTAATQVSDLATDFGMQSLLGKRGWVADDAIGEGEALDPERYKKIVTGEEIGVRRKNRTDLMVRFGFPVMITANHLPHIRDQSDAVYNRSLVLPMTRVHPPGSPEPAGYDSISAKIIAEELTGVLWWALEGWQRLSARGVFAEPECMKRAVTEMQDNNNPVGSWAKEAIELDPQSKVAVADLFASFAGWYHLENGDGKFLWSQNKFKRRISQAYPQLIYQKTGNRAFCGLRLTDEGLDCWDINADRDNMNAPKKSAPERFSVNQTYDVDRANRMKAVIAAAPADRTPRF